MEKISYKLDAFEGPLDLLLHLIEKNKLNIYDIQISELLEQYMEHIELMQQQDLDIAGEFLAMASKLVQIKSAMLLPKFEEAEEMRRELSGQLIEYQKCKKVARLLSANISFDSFCRDPAKIKADMTYRRSHEPSYLTAAYLTAAGRGKAKLPQLWGGQKKKYSAIFDDASDKSELVATFLAVLELIKGKRVRIEGEGDEQELKLINGGGKNWKKEK